MAAKGFCELPAARKALGKSQSEFAKLLGISIRAVQSYEQGWRPTPPYVQKLAAMLLFLEWRKGRKSVQPCWKVRRCDGEARSQCTAFLMQAGDVCWMLGESCPGGEITRGDKKLSSCRTCPVTQAWLA